MDIEKWQRAVIHIECAGSAQYISARHEKLEETVGRWRKGQLSFETFLALFAEQYRNHKFSGTALWLCHQEEHYLLSCKQLLQDEINPGTPTGAANPFQAIFVLPALEELMSDPQPAALELSNETVQGRRLFVHPIHNVALLSLGKGNCTAVQRLAGRGLRAVTRSSLCCEAPRVGEPVFTVGFPASGELVLQNELLLQDPGWRQAAYSVPVTGFGRVIMALGDLPYFWTDLSLYLGNGGSPVVAGDQMVGLVNSQTLRVGQGAGMQLTPQPFNSIIKSSHVLELLDQIA